MPAGQPLGDEGRVISGARQRAVADGPFAESKEAVGGYVIVRAVDFEEAMKIAGSGRCWITTRRWRCGRCASSARRWRRWG